MSDLICRHCLSVCISHIKLKLIELAIKLYQGISNKMNRQIFLDILVQASTSLLLLLSHFESCYMHKSKQTLFLVNTFKYFVSQFLTQNAYCLHVAIFNRSTKLQNISKTGLKNDHTKITLTEKLFQHKN